MSSSPQRQLRLVPPSRESRPKAPASRAPAFDDSALLAGLNERDPAMCAAFYERARPVIDRTLSKLLGAHDPEYEDVAQMAMYELVNTLPRFRGECPLDAWLSIITGRMVYRHIRRRRLERRIFSATPGDELLAESQTRPVSLALRQALDRVRSHLARMDDRRVWTFLLHDVYGYDLKEASQITGVSLSAAQSRLVRGRREIHDRIRRDPNLARLLDDLAEEAP